MTKLHDICFIEKGKTPIQNCNPGEYPLVVTSEKRLSADSYQFDREAVCIPMVSSSGHGHASLKRVHYQVGKFALGNILCAVYSKNENILKTKYLYLYLQFNKDTILVPLMKGSANVSLSQESLKNLELSIPDIETQNMIVNKYEHLENSIRNIKSKKDAISNKYNYLVKMLISMSISQEKTVYLRMKDLFNIEKGKLQSSKATPGKYDFITASEDWKTHHEYTHNCEALIFAMGASGSLGRTHYVNGCFISSDLCYILTPKLNINLTFYNSLFEKERENIVKDCATGTSKLAINQKNFSNYVFPYIIRSEQDKYMEIIVKIRDLKNKFEEIDDHFDQFLNVSINKLFC